MREIFVIFVLHKPNNLKLNMNGKVKWFDPKKGYGFIVAEDGSEIFVHYTGIVKEGFKALNEGQLVTYEVGEGDKGVQAVNVQILPKE
jgi:CspA family cold shock protein